jgi:hypothetical protein
VKAFRLVAGKESFRWRRPGVRAVVIREFGPPEVLEPAEVAEVRARPDEVVIEVEAPAGMPNRRSPPWVG